MPAPARHSTFAERPPRILHWTHFPNFRHSYIPNRNLIPRMNTPKTTVAVLFGGQSSEHEVSLVSARNVIRAIDTEQYHIVLIGIDKQGQWHYTTDAQALGTPDPDALKMRNRITPGFGIPVYPIPSNATGQLQLRPLDNPTVIPPIDVVFPVLHGPFGEDGSIQGLFKLLNVPYVGADGLGTAVGMDKDVMKKLLIADGLPVGRYLALLRHERENLPFGQAVDFLGLPIFVKPANAGSSVGISKVRNADEYEAALDLAFRHDNKVLLEENIPGREIECAVLGNETIRASILGEIVPTHDFYSFDAKYIDDAGAHLVIPAPIPDPIAQHIRKIAIQTFKTLCHEGLGRVDCFLTESGEIFVNEINSMPGFTNVSMYPRLWEASGMSQPQLVHELIQLARQRHARDQRLHSAE